MRKLTFPKTFLATFVLLVAALAPVSQAQTIRLISSPGKFFVDDKSGNGIVYNYAAYLISNNTASTLPGVFVQLTNVVSTNRIQLAVNDTGVRGLGALTAGQTKMAAFYLKGPSFTGNSDSLLNLTNENHTIKVLNGPPGVGSVLTSATFGFTNILYVIEAAANKVTIITNLNPYAVIGDTVDLVIGGDTGTIGGQNTLAFSPAVLNSWRPDCYELVSCVMRFTMNPTYTNALYFDPTVPGFTNFSGQSYTNTFTFRAVAATGTNIAVSPFAFIDSGANVKHTALTSLSTSGGSNVIVSATNAILISSHTVLPSSILAPGGTVTYSIVFSNTSSIDLVLDEIVNTLPGVPTNMNFVIGSATYDGMSLGNPNITGQILHWPTPFPVNANTSSVLTFQATVPLTSGQYTNSVIAKIGPTQIDATLDSSDDNPSRSVLTVVPVVDIVVGKTAPASILASSNFTYAISITNLGPSPASSLAITDNLPATVTFVSASGGGVFTGGNVIWTNLGPLAASATTNLTITVTSPADGTSLTNTATANSLELDSNSTNNTSPPTVTSVIPRADVGITKTGPAGSVFPGSNFNYTITIANAGPSIADNLSVTDALPANVTFVSASGGGTLSGSQVIWNLGNFPAALSSNLTLTVAAPLKGGITNIASAGSEVLDENPTNNTTPPAITTVSNVPPTVVNDTASGPKNISLAIPVLTNDTDANDDPLLLVAVTQTNGGTASISDTNVVFAPSNNFIGTVVLTYSVSDGSGGTNFGLISISITNRPPTASNDSTFGTNGVPQVIDPLVNDSDPDGDSLTITAATAVGGIVTINAGSTNLTFTPTNNNTGTINYTISDGSGGTASATITVIGQNVAPIANDDSTNTLEDVSVTITPLDNDTDGNGDTLSIVSASPTNGTIMVIGGTNIVFTPATNFNGTATIGYSVTDGNGETNSALITVTVVPVNDLPIVQDDSTNTLEDVSVTISPLVNDSDVDGDALTIVDVSPTNGTASISGTNVVFTPAANFNGIATIGYTITDGNGATNSAVITVTVAPVNDAPVANDDSTNTLEDVSVTITPLDNDTDADGDTLTIIDISPTNGTAVIIGGTNIVFTPATNFNGTAFISYTIIDGNGGTNAGLINVTVIPVNDVPVALDDTTNTLEDVIVTISPLVNDSDVDGDTLTVVNVSPTNGSAVISGTNVVFTPAPDFNGTATIGYTITDGNGGTNSAVITVTVAPVNDAPIAVDDTTNTLEDVSVTIHALENDSDVDGDTLTIVSVNATNGSAIISGTNIVFTPTLDFNGAATIGYTITDGNGGTNSALVTITVIAVNDAPVAQDDSTNTLEDVSVTISPLVNDSDVDGDSLTITSVSPTNGTALISGTNVVFTPNGNFNGTATIGYSISDGNGGTASALITITVAAVNDAPIAADDSTNTLEDVSVTINPLVNDGDVDGDALTITSVSPTNGTAFISGTNVVFTPAADFNGTATIGYTISDGNGGTASALITVTVIAVNDTPVALDDPTNTLEDITVTISPLVNDSDVDGDVLTIVGVSATNGNAVVSGTNVVFTPAANFFGTATIGYTITDGNGGTHSALITITVASVNDAPAAVNDATNTLEDASVTISPLVNDSDVDGDTLSIVSVNATNGSAVISGTNVVFTPVANFFGTATIGYTITDGNGGTNSALITVTVASVNDAPVALNDSTNTLEDVSVTISPLVNDSDLDGDALMITSASPTNGTALISGTNIVFTPTANFFGTATVGYSISDGNGGTASALITITVASVNDAPVAANDSTNTLEDVSVTIEPLVNDSDIDGDTLTITSVSPTNGSAVISGTNIVFTPTANFFGTATIGYSISDGNDGTASALITVTVAAVNDVPVAVNDSTNTLEDVSVTIRPLVNDTDADGDTLTIISASATNGSAMISGTNVVFTPNTNFNGTATIGYTITDGNGGTNSALITVTVSAVNDPPVAVNDSVTTLEDMPVIVAPVTNDFDVDGNTLTVINVSTTNTSICGLTSMTGTNGVLLLTITPCANSNGTAFISYTISDGNGGTASATITLSITPVNDIPIAVNDSTNTLEDTSVTIRALANDSDADGDALTIVAVNPTNGTASISGTNVVFTPTANFNGAGTIGYTITDGNGGTNSALITVTIAAVNDAPVANDDSTNTLEDVSITVPVLVNDSDVDGDTLTIQNVLAINGSATISGTNIVFTPNTNFNGTGAVLYVISDGNGGTASATVTVTVNSVNDAPIASNDSTNTVEDMALIISPLVNDSDVDGDTLTIVSVNPTNGSASISGTNVLFTPTANFNGIATIGYTISDGNSGTASALITITVVSVNDAPVAADNNTNTLEDVAVTIPVLVNDSDADGDALTIVGVSPTNGTAVVSGTNIVFTPTTNFFGTATVGYTISDGNGGTASALVTITVLSVNDVPIAVDDTASTPANTPITIDSLANDYDGDGDLLTIIDATATNGTVVIVGGTNLFFTPALNFSGAAFIAYTISDGNGGTASALVTVSVANVPPAAVDDVASTPENTPVVIIPLANDSDADNDPLSIISVSPTNGSASIINGTNILFTPSANFVGTATVGYTISDGRGGTSSAVVTVAVSAEADVSVSKSGPDVVLVGSTITYTISVTNNGPSIATNVIVTDNLPTNLTFQSASAGGAFSNGVVTWPGITLLNGEFTNYTLTAIASGTNTFTNTVSGTSATFDPNPPNNNGTSSGGQVTTVGVTAQFGISAGAIVFNAQNGLFEQIVFVTNLTVVPVPGVRLYVTSMPSGVSLYNASGTNGSGPYVQYNLPLDAGAVLRLRLEFRRPGSRSTFSVSLLAEAVSGNTNTTAGSGVVIDRQFVDNRIGSEMRFVLEFKSTIGSRYTVIYSDDLEIWKVAVPSITAAATRTQWYDDGPPKTDSKPSMLGNRFYRVVEQ